MECWQTYIFPDGNIYLVETPESDGYLGGNVEYQVAEFSDPLRFVTEERIWGYIDIPNMQPGDVVTYHLDAKGDIYAERYTGRFTLLQVKSGRCLTITYEAEKDDIIRDFLEHFWGANGHIGGLLCPETRVDDDPSFRIEDLLIDDPGSLRDLLADVDLGDEL